MHLNYKFRVKTWWIISPIIYIGQLVFSKSINLIHATYYQLLLYSYHQKYRLRAHGDILALLQLNNEELKDSVIAARLNGYLGQNGSKKQFDSEVKELNLIPDIANAVRKVLF